MEIVVYKKNKLTIEGKEIILPMKTDFDDKFEDFFKEIQREICNSYQYDGLYIFNFARGTIVETLREIIIKIETLIFIIEQYGDGIEIKTDNEVFEYISKVVFEIKTELIVEKIYNKISYIKLGKEIIKGILEYNRFNSNSDKEKFLIITNDAGTNSIDIDNKTIMYDSYYGKLYNEIRKNYNTLELSFSSDLSKKSNCLSKDYIPFQAFRIYKKLFGKKLLDKNKIINKINSIKKSWKLYKGYDISEVINTYIIQMLESLFENYIIEMLVAQKLVVAKKINKLIVLDEADRFRCFIVAGNRNKIKTYAVQHGIISKASCSYLIPSENPVYIPQKTFVWGEADSDFLTKNTLVYNSNNTYPVGQLRTDILVDLLKDNKINDHNRDNIKVLYATQTILDLSEDATKILFKALENMKDYELLIKLHPLEKNTEFYEKLIKEMNIKNVKIVKNEDIYKCLLWCDIVVSVHSTVILEGILLNKPSICILLPNYYDQGNFVKDGISVGIQSSGELIDILNKAKASSELYNMSNLLESKFYKIDGLVHTRIMGEIEHE